MNKRTRNLREVFIALFKKTDVFCEKWTRSLSVCQEFFEHVHMCSQSCLWMCAGPSKFVRDCVCGASARARQAKEFV